MSTKTIFYAFDTDTTDVQLVTAAVYDEVNNVIVVQCNFVPGSDAQGCMVILIGEFGNITLNLTREGVCTTLMINQALPLSCYRDIIAFDIESDKSVGTLAVSGVIVRSITNDLCSSTTTIYPTRK